MKNKCEKFNNGTWVCYCGKCEPQFYPLPENYIPLRDKMAGYSKSLPSMKPKIILNGWWWKKYFRYYQRQQYVLDCFLEKGSYTFLNNAMEKMLDKFIKNGFTKEK